MTNFMDVASSFVTFPGGIPLRRLSRRVRFGEHKSPYLGKGPDFYQIRDFNPEKDSPHRILWYQPDPECPMVRDFIEPKEMAVLLVVDLSSSISFGFEASSKERLVLEIMGTLGVTSAGVQNRVGLIGFTDSVALHYPPRLGEGYVHYLVGEVFRFFRDADLVGRTTDMKMVISTILQRYLQPSLIILISDFVGWEELPRYRLMRQLSEKHELICILVDDPDEFDVGRRILGSIRRKNMETGNLETISILRLRKERKALLKNRQIMKEECKKIGVDFLELALGDHNNRLASFLEERRLG